MKTIIVFLVIASLAAAAPKPIKLHYRKLFKSSLNKTKINPNPRIIGGNEAVPHSIPYQAFMEIYTHQEAWYCGGSLISANYVLNAAHCNEDAIEARVILGAHKPQQSETTQEIFVSTDITSHEIWNHDKLDNDIGVIKLPEAVTFTNAIQPVTLPSRANTSNTYEGQIATVSGWGTTNGQVNQLSPVLNYAEVAVISNDECEETFGNLPESILCTSGGEDSGYCNGDSGGPLAIDGVQIGLGTSNVR